MTEPARCDAFDRALDALMLCGLLPEQHDRLPSVAAHVGGGPLQAEAVAAQLAFHEDVLVTRLLAGQATYVHRQLWPAVVAVGASREPWQMEGLSELAGNLLSLIDELGDIETAQVEPDAARELDQRLLVHAGPTRLSSWARWCCEHGFDAGSGVASAADGKIVLEEAVETLNEGFGARVRLPWKK